MIRLLIADDHEIVRDGLKFVVSQSPDIRVVGEADSGDALLGLVQRVEADLLLLDVNMPGPGVLETIHQIRELRPSVRILVLSVSPEQHYARRVLKAGADGYLTKSHSSGMLVSVIRQVHAGHKYISPTLAQDLALDLLPGSGGRPPHEVLSNREYEVLLQLGSGKRVDDIASQLGLSSKTVRTYRARIIDKLSLKSTAELIFYAVSRGLIADLPPKTDSASVTSPRRERPRSHRRRRT